MAKTDLIERLRMLSQHKWETVRTEVLREAADAIEKAEALADAAQVVIDFHTLPVDGSERWVLPEGDPHGDLLAALNLYRVATMGDTYGISSPATAEKEESVD